MRSKKKINVHIVGAGSIGVTLARQLSRDGCAVTVVDTDPAVVKGVSNSLDVICYQGNGASYTTLQESHAGDADIFIAVADSDELNILSCLTAHLLGAKHTVARVRDVDYAKQSEFYQRRLGLSMTINPELEAAQEISRVLRFPSATRMEVFAKGRAELMDMALNEKSPLCDKSLMEIGRKNLNILICAVVRGDEVYIPKGDFVLQAGDVLYLTGGARAFRNAFRQLDLPVRPAHTALIAGAGRTTYYLAELLVREGVKVTVVDHDHAAAVELCRALPDCSVMNDDAITYLEAMSDADVESTDAFLALTGNEEYNVVAAMYAAARKIPKVITRLSAGSRLRTLQKHDRVDTFSQEDAAADAILGYTRPLMNAEGNDAMESLCRLVDGRIEVAEFRITEGSPLLGKPIRDWRMKPDTLVACIMRGPKTIIPGGADVVLPGDSILIATMNRQIARLEDVFEAI